jgi:hypothetical protein
MSAAKFGGKSLFSRISHSEAASTNDETLSKEIREWGITLRDGLVNEKEIEIINIF